MVKRFFTGLALAALMLSSPLFAANVPALKGRVNDYAKIIRDSDEREIEEYLAGVEQACGAQIAVLTMPSLDGEDIASFAIKVADKWKLGDKEKDNGAILLVAYAEHDLRIEVGDGLEGSLTDAKCGLILRNVVVPEFKNGNYSAGIRKGVMNMGAIASGDESAVSKSVREGEDNSSNDLVPVFAILVWLIFVVSMISANARRGRRRGRYYHNGNTIAWIAADAALRSMMGSGRSGGSHSSGGFGGFSGGGGHFSGGGASAHW
jgi:uncharacterized protein